MVLLLPGIRRWRVAGSDVGSDFCHLTSVLWFFDIVNRFLASGDWLWPIVGSIQVFDGKTCEWWGVLLIPVF
jgi:hypothetical protein